MASRRSRETRDSPESEGEGSGIGRKMAPTTSKGKEAAPAEDEETILDILVKDCREITRKITGGSKKFSQEVLKLTEAKMPNFVRIKKFEKLKQKLKLEADQEEKKKEAEATRKKEIKKPKPKPVPQKPITTKRKLKSAKSILGALDAAKSQASSSSEEEESSSAARKEAQAAQRLQEAYPPLEITPLVPSDPVEESSIR